MKLTLIEALLLTSQVAASVNAIVLLGVFLSRGLDRIGLAPSRSLRLALTVAITISAMAFVIGLVAGAGELGLYVRELVVRRA